MLCANVFRNEECSACGPRKGVRKMIDLNAPVAAWIATSFHIFLGIVVGILITRLIDYYMEKKK
jgi:hypothetical protein